MSPEHRRTLTRLYLQRLARSSKPILIGPWRSEVGFETLYHLPFLRWAVGAFKIDPKRLVTVTRGGAGVLYGTQAIDLYRLRSVDSVRAENQYDWQGSKLQKQMACTDWDRDVLKEAAAQTLGRGESYHVLHPSWMYWALEPFWSEARGFTYLSSMTDYTPIQKIAYPAIELPQKYVAMKWYHRATFPAHDEAVQQLIGQVTGIVGAQAKIVLLSGSPETDDHMDVTVTHPNIVTLPKVAPDENLALQLQVLAHATAFVGTYGGMAQAALRLGVPSCSFYSQWGGTALAHLHLSGTVSKMTKVPFVVGSLEDAHLWRQVVSVPMQVKADA